MNEGIKVWFDITNTPQVHFLIAIKKILSEEFVNFIYSARNFSETISLLQNHVSTNDLIITKSTYGKTSAGKIVTLLARFRSLQENIRDFDLSVSCGSEPAIWNSWLRGKKSIAFGDNDTAKQWTYARFVDYAFFPDAIDTRLLEKQGLKNKLYQYHGLKEDIYISYFKPDDDFLKKIPFENYVVVRPENIHANYLKNNKVKTIVPELLYRLSSRGYNIIYLPRYSEDQKFASGIRNISIPESPLNGLDLCHYSDAVLTGAGTLAREAACLGIPSFSFYAGKQLLAVDRKLISEKRVVYSRDVDTLVSKIPNIKRRESDFSKSTEVREEVKNKLLERIKSLDL